MRSGRISAIIILLVTVLMFTNTLTFTHSNTTTQYSGLRTNRLILSPSNLTFNYNDKFEVFLLMENNGQQVIYNLNFNYTVEKTLFSIVSSSNKTSLAKTYVYNNIDELAPGQKITFNMTLQVVSNNTKTGVIVSPMTLNYQFGYGTNRIPGVSTTNSLTVNIVGPNTSDVLQSGVTGNFKVDSIVLSIIFAFPIILAFILSFMFGRRRNKF